jgi:transposase
LKEKGISPYIPPRKHRKEPALFDEALYKQRHCIENMFGGIEDWRRIATRYDRCAHTFFSAILVAATCCCYLDQCVLSLDSKGWSDLCAFI